MTKRRRDPQHDPKGGFASLCAICGGPVAATRAALLWCLRCLNPYIDRYAGFEPVITVRRHYSTNAALERR